jgi:peptide/nickel transport system permease protein
MLEQALSRLVQAIPTLLLSTVLVFLLIRLVPGDPARILVGYDAPLEEVEAVRESLGLDQPLPVQYVRWLGRVVQGDFGRSLINRFPVGELIALRFPATLELAMVGLVLAILVSVPLGILAALRAGGTVDYTISAIAAFFLGTPNFWIGILYILIFSVNLRWLPPSGGVPLLQDRLEALRFIAMPAVTLALPLAMAQMRFIRASLLEVLNQDYVRTARAKGLAEQVVVTRHALRNALVPIVTVMGIQFGHLLGGAVIVESLFGWPGLGRMLVDSIANRDYAVTQAGLLYLVALFVFVNLLVDLLYVVLDPRLRSGQSDG